MRSGNGRHRRPRQAPALLVTAGVTGAGIAIPLLAAAGAQAAGASTWDRVAECESGGMWSADEGNGYYGGLQLTQETWEQYGGTDFAERPDLASRSQQITVAEKILDDQGPTAWPSCGPDSGLTPKSADVDPDVDTSDEQSTPIPERPYSGDASTARKTKDGTTKGSYEGPEHTADPSAGPSASDGASAGDTENKHPADDGKHRWNPSSGEDRGGDPAQGSGRHRGKPDPDEEGRGRDGGDRPSRGGGAQGRGDAEADGAHKVRTGDSLSAIAEEYGVRGGWSALYELNRDVVGSDPDLILPGQDLKL